ncbi:MAG: hypothetical protein WBA50_21380, partial [Mycobacterium sp.]
MMQVWGLAGATPGKGATPLTGMGAACAMPATPVPVNPTVKAMPVVPNNAAVILPKCLIAIPMFRPCFTPFTQRTSCFWHPS